MHAVYACNIHQTRQIIAPLSYHIHVFHLLPSVASYR